MENTDRIERVVLADGYWERDPNADNRTTAGGVLRQAGETVYVTEEEAKRQARYLGTPEEYATLSGQPLLSGHASAQAAIPTAVLDDEGVAAMTVPEVLAYLSQHSSDPDEVDRIEGIENEREAPRVTVLKAVEGIRANQPEGAPGDS